jgi:hypothetical protein
MIPKSSIKLFVHHDMDFGKKNHCFHSQEMFIDNNIQVTWCETFKCFLKFIYYLLKLESLTPIILMI